MTVDAARRHRLASDHPSVRAGVRWELWIESRLAAAGAALELHPEVPGLTRRPDLMARVGDDDLLYVEATATGGGALDGHRQFSVDDRLHDVLMSRLKHKSRAFQGIDAPLVIAVLCVADTAGQRLADAVATELFDPGNDRGRNVSAIVVGWGVDAAGLPMHWCWRAHPDPLHSAPAWAAAAFA